jgi:hypothetical protein
MVSKGSGHAFSTEPELFAFAEETAKQFALDCPQAIVDGLFRVDIMQTSDGRLIVNEFESFEADYECTNVDCNREMRNLMDAYWKRIVDEMI